MTRRTTNPPPRTDATRRSAAHDLAITSDDLHLFNEGTHYRLYEKLGAHLAREGGRDGCRFTVWAPSARTVSVVGDFNGWAAERHPLEPVGQSGLWSVFLPQIGEGVVYKYHIVSRFNDHEVDKADPYGFYHEVPPRTASIVRDLAYDWQDADWMRGRGQRNALDRPMSIYEMHVGSWMHGDDGAPLSYRQLAPRLADHVRDHGFTHVELLPIMEHPFSGSWGYQLTGYFAPTSRYGTPQDFMALIDHLHHEGIGVILDWVPSHFTTDEHGLGYFDGTHLYEHADRRQGFHPDWGSLIFNYDRHEVRAFLISNAIFWLDRYHIDGLRVDAVASMLYLDYSRNEGEWIPNEHGGRENLGAISFLRQLNHEVYGSFPDVQVIAEESTAWPMVSRPTYLGGLGFGLKWDMGWMHDVLEYMKLDPIHRQHHHNALTFRAVYQGSENYVLPLSHDEVVHGKGSLLGRMPGDGWQRFANLRLLLTHQWMTPGKKLLFMGGEIGQWAEWNHDGTLDWPLLEHDAHKGIQRLVGDLNRIYRTEPALHELDCDDAGFRWLDPNDAVHSLLTYMRRGRRDEDVVVVAMNFTPVPRHHYRIGLPHGGPWRELLNTDAPLYGGSGQGNLGGVEAAPFPYQDQPFLVDLTLPPLGGIVLKPGAAR